MTESIEPYFAGRPTAGTEPAEVMIPAPTAGPQPAEVTIPAPTARVNIDIKSNAGRVYLVISEGETQILPISLTPAQALSMANRLRGKANDLLHAEFMRGK